MKLKSVSLILLLALVLTACTAQGFVSLPDDVVLGINAVAVLLFGYGIAYVIALVPFLSFLKDFQVPLAAAISAQVIQFLQVSIPDQFGAVAVHALRALLALIAIYTAAKQLNRQGVI